MRRAIKRTLASLWKAFCYTLGLLFIALLLYQGWFAAHIWYWVGHNPESTSFMQARLEHLRAKNPNVELKQRWASYARISDELKRAVVVAEDAKFSEHDGFDWEGIQKALEKNQKKGRVVAGGSTISQQLAKNLFLSGQKNLWRKGQEAVITWMIEMLMDKERILEIYLNVAEWGDGVFGAEAAARHYYNVGAAGLNAEQAARLAAMLPRPLYYERNRDSQFLQRYSETIRARMPSAQLP
ncbi:MAG: monofunctional biosynthetic peptidoglycan transglycosylase [Betaproteobacteria bacterium RIFCSPLOWO2_12_FULL_64_23]|nr:MAG: monofunctional biosynthetic peptidoglycan transglycosylase [Betaproteobacteria bacterium RIFCSPLOWO2_12_FULL_64_23]